MFPTFQTFIIASKSPLPFHHKFLIYILPFTLSLFPPPFSFSSHAIFSIIPTISLLTPVGMWQIHWWVRQGGSTCNNSVSSLFYNLFCFSLLSTMPVGAMFQKLTTVMTSDHASVVSMNIFVALLCACIIIGHLLEENRWINESITALLIVRFLIYLFYCSYQH